MLKTTHGYLFKSFSEEEFFSDIYTSCSPFSENSLEVSAFFTLLSCYASMNVSCCNDNFDIVLEPWFNLTDTFP